MVGQNVVLTSQNALEWLSQESVFLNWCAWHSNSYLTFNHSYGMYMTLEQHVNVISENKNRIVPFERCCKDCYINFSALKADDEIKVRRIFTFKTLIYVQHIMRVSFVLLCFLLILLVSILFSVSCRSFCYFRLLKLTMRKNRWNTVYASDSIQQKRLPVSLEVGIIYF